MTCVVRGTSTLQPDTVYILYDMEAVGDVRYPSQCRIWDLAAMNLSTGETFSQIIDPQQQEYTKPTHPDLFHVTHTFLRSNNAQPFKVVGESFYQWVHRFGGGARPVVFISHGNFILDKPLLEYEMGRLGKVLPATWYFYDTLPWFRSVYKKQESYSMKHLHKVITGGDIQHHHFASPDVQALHTLLNHSLGKSTGMLIPSTELSTRLTGTYYPPYFTPLQRVRYLGTYNENLLIQGGVTCVQDLHLMLIRQCRLNIQMLQHILHQQYHIRMDSAMKIAQSVLHMLLCPRL